LLASAVDVFDGEKPPSEAPDLKTLHAKIGQLALENDFLEDALIKAGWPIATRWMTAPTRYEWGDNANS